jgi:glycosyltransferase involved in cell wall biosynthesis
MKIVIAASAYPPDVKGGGEISTRLLAQGLAEHGAEVVVVTVGRSSSIVYEGSIKIVRHPPPNIYWSLDYTKKRLYEKLVWHVREAWLPLIRQLWDTILREKPDLLHTSTVEDVSTALWTHAARNGLASVHTLRSYTLLCPKGTMFRDEQACSKACFGCAAISYPKRLRSSVVSGVIGVSKFILQKHVGAGHFAQAHKIVIPNPVSKPTALSNATCVQSRKTRGHALILGYLGRIVPEKGVEVLIRAVLAARRPGLSLRIAGTGSAEYLSKLQRIADGCPVIFEAWCDPEVFLSEIDALVVPSLWEEPFGRVVAEALSVGCPVIASSRGGLAELIDRGRNGEVFDPDDKATLVNILKGLSRKNLDTWAEGTDRAFQMYNSESVARQHLHFYEEILR